jgi:hypothetical protein
MMFAHQVFVAGDGKVCGDSGTNTDGKPARTTVRG